VIEWYMARPLKICAQCLAFLRESNDGQRDLAAYLMGTGAGGVEIVQPACCQARLTEHRDTVVVAAASTNRSLADVTPDELDQALALLLKQLRLSGGCGEDVWDLENAVKAEWLKALEARKQKSPASDPAL